MEHAKKETQGKCERLQVLSRCGLELDLTRERKRLGRSKVGEDDLIDAAACLLTARRIQDGTATVFPSGQVETDAKGLRMEIVA